MIIKQLKVPKSTVYDTIARFKELDDDKNRPRSESPCTACTHKIIKVACERVTPTKWCSFPHIQKNSSMVLANFSNFWSKKMWPLASPDLNSLDFNIWSILEAEACAKTHNTVEGLKAFLKKAWAKIPQEKLHVSVESFRGRLESSKS